MINVLKNILLVDKKTTKKVCQLILETIPSHIPFT